MDGKKKLIKVFDFNEFYFILFYFLLIFNFLSKSFEYIRAFILIDCIKTR